MSNKDNDIPRILLAFRRSPTT